MKLIRINESQRKRLFEAYTDGFSFEYLSVIGRGQFGGEDNTEKQYEYCCKYLGNPISDGSSREVFQLDDNFVLKLANGYEGFKQNENEVTAFETVKSKLLTRIIYYDNNYSFIVSEHVLPASPEDFEKILGLPYFENYVQQSIQQKARNSRYGGDVTVGYDKYFDKIVPRGTHVKGCVYDILCDIQGMYRDKVNPYYEALIENIWWFGEIRRLVNEYKIYDLFMNNFGVAYRNGEPTLVILDSGINTEQEDY
jgi:hypothetical protein